jgi:hypothetical protein
MKSLINVTLGVSSLCHIVLFYNMDNFHPIHVCFTWNTTLAGYKVLRCKYMIHTFNAIFTKTLVPPVLKICSMTESVTQVIYTELVYFGASSHALIQLNCFLTILLMLQLHSSFVRCHHSTQFSAFLYRLQ